MKIFFIASQLCIVHAILYKYRATYNPKLDSFKVEVVVVPALLLALILPVVFFDRQHAGGIFRKIFEVRTLGASRLKNNYNTFFPWPPYTFQYFWTFSILLESVAILPQMFQLQKTGEAEAITTHYLLCLGSYRVLYLFNWIYRWFMNDPTKLVVVLAGLLQTGLYSDFFWIYYKRVFNGRAFKLPI
jgi:ER lumen protein retaining receptor